ncbi:MAG: PD-(D/E)XK nuclease family protein [Bacteroidales bacterium]|jgi:RecB family exonuclease|nr:PD-(D/E)XK nuclease family protein [Bacteroidales bacterium]
MNTSNRTGFLLRLASALVEKKELLQNTIVLLPSHRAIQYLNEEIIKYSNTPVFAPHSITIDDWVKKRSCYTLADEISLIYNLYLSYCNVFYARNNGMEQESFEQFYFWGKIVLADFDDIDKHLADASLLFTNLNQYKDIESRFNPLTPEQKDLLTQFFDSFKAQKEISLRENFTDIWDCLADIYLDFRLRLQKQGLAYSGMMYREIYERLLNNEISITDYKFVIAGFNVLSKSEEKIFEYLRDNNAADFYWDYDVYYTDNHKQEAGTFLRNNLINFPNKVFENENFNHIKTNDQKLRIVASNGETLQAACVLKWVNDLTEIYGDTLKQEDMVIILANESLLPVVVKALPDKIGNEATDVNITMGYPFAQTPLYNFVEKFMTTETDHLTPVAALEKLSMQIGEMYGKLSQNETDNVLIESAYQIDVKIKDLITALKNTADNAVSKTFIQKTLMADLRSLSLPFQSNDTKGLQIMGMLESRNLDFRHVLMLSTNDDYIPNVSTYSTFIPHSLRKFYGLMSVEKRISVFAYYFYRLFHCAETLTFVYNTQGESTKVKEKSRFLMQAELEMGKSFEHINVTSQANFDVFKPNEYPKKQEHIALILNKEYLSAHFINTMLDCELKMYFQYLLRLDSLDYEQSDMSALAFGNLFHHSAGMLYDNTGIINNKPLVEIVNLALNKMEKEEERRLIKQMHKDITVKYLEILIAYNQKQKTVPFLTEEPVIKTLKINNGKEQKIKLGGIIDRIDFCNGNLTITDYKTGGEPQKLKTLPLLFRNMEGKRADYVFQILFYCWLLWDNDDFKQKHNISFSSITPQLLYIHKLKANGGSSLFDIYDAEMHETFSQILKESIENLFAVSEGTFYERNQNKKNCEYCPYAILCYKAEQETGNE